MKKIFAKKLIASAFLLALMIYFSTSAKAQTESVENTWWGYTDGVTVMMDFSFKKGGKVILTMSDMKDEKKVEGTYTQRGNRIEMDFPSVTFKGDISGDDYGNWLDLIGTIKKDNSSFKLTVAENDY